MSLLCVSIKLYLPVLILSTTCVSYVHASSPDEVATDELRAEIAHVMSSIKTLSFTAAEYNVDAEGNIDKANGWTQHEVTVNFDGMRKLKTLAAWPNKTKFVTEFWENGQNHYGINRLANNSNIIDTIVVSKQSSDALNYHGIMCIPLWVLSPAGKPLSEAVSKRIGSSLERKPTSRFATLTFAYGKDPVRCTLDSTHDWWPSEVVAEGMLKVTVDQFDRANGHWFPKSGTFERLNDHYKQRFAITQMSINQVGLHKNDFDLIATLKPGVLVINKATREGMFIGGIAAREEFIRTSIDANLNLANVNAEANKSTYYQTHATAISTYGIPLGIIGMFVLSLFLIRASKQRSHTY